jgi:hypothetical protein
LGFSVFYKLQTNPLSANRIIKIRRIKAAAAFTGVFHPIDISQKLKIRNAKAQEFDHILKTTILKYEYQINAKSIELVA